MYRKMRKTALQTVQGIKLRAPKMPISPQQLPQWPSPPTPIWVGGFMRLFSILSMKLPFSCKVPNFIIYFTKS